MGRSREPPGFMRFGRTSDETKVARVARYAPKRLPSKALGDHASHQLVTASTARTKRPRYRNRCATWLTTYANARMIRVRIRKFFLGGRLNPTGRIKYPKTKRIARIVSATIISPGRSAVNIWVPAFLNQKPPV